MTTSEAITDAMAIIHQEGSTETQMAIFEVETIIRSQELRELRKEVISMDWRSKACH